MTETKFTPGPWTFITEKLTGDCGFRAEGTGVFIETFSDIRKTGEGAREEALANAHLISTSPELYEACAPFADTFDLIRSETEGFSDDDEFDLMFGDYQMQTFKVSDFRKANAALAKARRQAHD